LPPRDEGLYLARIKRFVLLTFGLFFLSIWVGIVAGPHLPFQPLEFVRRAFGGLLGLGPVALVVAIFLNNALKSLAALLLGVLFGIAPAVFVMVNGFLIGALAQQLVQTRGLALVLAAFLPHGVLELPSVLISSAIGMRFGHKAVRSLMGQGELRNELRAGLRFFLRWLVPILLVAAAVEVLVTPIIVRTLGS